MTASATLSKSKEIQEGSKAEVLTASAINGASNEVWESNINADLDYQMTVAPEKPENFENFKQSMVRILSKMAKKNVDITKMTPSLLPSIARKTLEKELSISENNTLQILESGVYNRQLQGEWANLIETVVESKKGMKEWYVENLKEHTGLTILATVAGAFGIYLCASSGYKWAKEKIKGKAKEAKNSIFSGKNIAGALIMIATGAFFKKEALAEMLKKQFGLDLGVKKAKEIMDQVAKGKIDPDKLEAVKSVGAIFTKPEEVAKFFPAGKIPKEMSEMFKKDRFLTEKAIKDHLAAKKTEIAAQINKKKEDLKKKVESKLKTPEQYKRYSEFITKQNPDLNVSPDFLEALSGQDYQKFLLVNGKTGTLRIIAETWMKFRDIMKRKGGVKNGVTEAEKAASAFAAHNLFSFFNGMLQNPEHTDFKGKTIGQVMALIYETEKENKYTYVDEEKVKEAKDRPEHMKKLGKLLARLDKDPINFAKEFRENKDGLADELLGTLAMAGVYIVITRTGEGILMTVDNAIPVAKFTGERACGALHYIADTIRGDGKDITDNATAKYLEVAGYVAFIGAPVGAVKGLAKGVARKPFNPFYWFYSGGKGALKGTASSLKWGPKSAGMLYRTIRDYKVAGITPIDNLKDIYYEKTFFKESLKHHITLKKGARKVFGETLARKALDDHKLITKSLVNRLTVYRGLLVDKKANVYNSVKGLKSGHRIELDRSIDEIDNVIKIAEKKGIRPTIESPLKKIKIENKLFKGSSAELAEKLKNAESELSGLSGGAKMAKAAEIEALSAYIKPKSVIPTVNLEKFASNPEGMAIKLDKMARTIEARSAGSNAYVKSEMKRIQALIAKEGGNLAHPDVQKQLTEIDEFIEKYTKSRAEALNSLSHNYKKLPKNFKTTALKKRIAFSMRAPEGSFLSRLKIQSGKAVMGRALAGAMITSGMFAIELLTKDDEQDFYELFGEFGPTAVQILVDILPFVGTGSMLWSAVSGKETVTDRELDTSGRLMNAAFGVASLAGDILTVISAGIGGAAATATRLAVLSRKGGKVGAEAVKLSKNWPRIYALMKKMGIRKFSKTAYEFAQGGGKLAKAKKALNVTKKLGAGAGAGILVTELGRAAYSFIGGHEVDIPSDIGIYLPENVAENTTVATEEIKQPELALAS